MSVERDGTSVTRVELDRGTKTAATIRIARKDKLIHVSVSDVNGVYVLSSDERDIVIAQYSALVTTCEMFHRNGLQRAKK